MSTSTTPLVWLITGANSGLGLSIALHALSQGHTVIPTARSLTKLAPSLLTHPNSHPLELQLTGPSASPSSLTETIASLTAQHTHLDVLVNNAGYGSFGPLEHSSDPQARAQLDLNFFAALSLTRAVLPHMRRRRSGVIVQMSSCAGFYAGMEGSSLYAASKFALEGMSEALAVEVARFGVRVHLVEPGYFRTPFPAAAMLERDRHGEKVEEEEKGEEREEQLGYMDMDAALAAIDGKQPGDPQRVGERVFEVVTGTGLAKGMEDELRVVLGSDSLAMMEDKIRQLGRTVERMRAIAPSTDY